MNKTVLALATALLLAGGTADTAFAKSHGNNGHHERNVQANSGHKHKNNGVRSDTHWDRSVVHDNDHDGIANHYDNFDNRWDRTRFRVSQPLAKSVLSELPDVTDVEITGGRWLVTGTGQLLSSVAGALARAQVVAEDLRVDQGNLDDAFVAMTGRAPESPAPSEGRVA